MLYQKYHLRIAIQIFTYIHLCSSYMSESKVKADKQENSP